MTNSYVNPTKMGYGYGGFLADGRKRTNSSKNISWNSRALFDYDFRGTMRHVLAYSSLAITLLTIIPLAFAQLILPKAQGPYSLQKDKDLDNIPIEIGFGWHEPKMGGGVQQNGPPLLSDILGIDRSLSIFAGLSRSVEGVVIA
jgi:hypothetical protein